MLPDLGNHAILSKLKDNGAWRDYSSSMIVLITMGMVQVTHIMNDNAEVPVSITTGTAPIAMNNNSQRMMKEDSFIIKFQVG